MTSGKNESELASGNGKLGTDKLPYLLRQNYKFRQFGLPILGIIIGLTIADFAALELWVLLVFHTGVWPILALQMAKRAKNPIRFEHGNMLFEAIICGLWIPFMACAALPSALIVLTNQTNLISVRGVKFGILGLGVLILAAAVPAYVTEVQVVLDPGLAANVLAGITGLFYMGTASNVAYHVRLKVVSTRKRLAESEASYAGLATKLARYLSPQVYDSIFAGKTDVQLKTYRKKLTVFFSDIKGFTELTDSMESEALTSLLNSYLDEMSSIALKHGGTIDKFIGDAIMVFFGDPESRGDKEDALACVEMAIEMREQIKSLRLRWRNSGVTKPLHIRVGINSGHCTVGNFGSESRMDYTIIGGQVNMASRLESSAGIDQILISEETYNLIRDKVACDKKDEISVKGISHPVQTYEVRNLYSALGRENGLVDAHMEGLSLNLDLGRVANTDEVRKVLQTALERLDEER